MNIGLCCNLGFRLVTSQMNVSLVILKFSNHCSSPQIFRTYLSHHIGKPTTNKSRLLIQRTTLHCWCGMGTPDCMGLLLASPSPLIAHYEHRMLILDVCQPHEVTMQNHHAVYETHSQKGDFKILNLFDCSEAAKQPRLEDWTKLGRDPLDERITFALCRIITSWTTVIQLVRVCLCGWLLVCVHIFMCASVSEEKKSSVIELSRIDPVIMPFDREEVWSFCSGAQKSWIKLDLGFSQESSASDHSLWRHIRD